MNKQELFRVFDACQPTVAQVQEYLERISGNSPFDLIFKNGDREVITKKLTYNMGELVGIVIETTVFYAQGMGKEHLISDDVRLSANDVFAFGKKFHPKARPMCQADLELLRRYQKKYLSLLDMLNVFGYSALPLQECYQLFEKATPCTYANDYDIYGDCNGNSDIAHFLYFRNIFFCSGWQVKI